MARLSLRLVVVGLLAALAFTSGTATAKADLLPGLLGGNCTSQGAVFAPWGDYRSYSFTSNGGLELGSTGWSLSGASVVSGNESFFVHSRTDRYSLLIRSGGKATSPGTCFGTTYPGLRLFAMSPSGSGKIRVRVITRSLLGILSILDGGTVTVGRDWAPTPKLATTLSNLSVVLGAKVVQFEFTATGDVQIDDLYVDPFLQEA